MKAIVYTKYGPPDVLQLREVAQPEPLDNQVLVKIQAASLNALDYMRFKTSSLIGRLIDEGLLKAVGKILGADIAGEVAAVGKDVTKFKPGDAVFGVSAGNVGGLAEYACAAENALALKPAGVSFEAAAALPVAGLTALQALRDKGQLQPGQAVLINGASGGVGTFAVQIARALGGEVTAVCSARNLVLARQIGADYVIDYRSEDFTRSGQAYDLIIAANGYHPLAAYRRALKPGGRYVALGGSYSQMLEALLLGALVSGFGNKKMGFFGIARVNQPDLAFLGQLVDNGKIKAVIERSFPLSQAAEAVGYIVKEHAQGKVVITVSRG